MNFPDVVTLAVPLFILSIIAEIAAWKVTRRGRYETRDAAASLLMGLGNQVAPLLGAKFLLAALWTWAYQFRLFDIPKTWWAVLLCFVLDDFRYYWLHRIAHERRLFWATHVVHHSSQHYNLTTALRQTWTGGLINGAIFTTPLVLIGFHPAMIVFAFGINLIYQFWIHTEMIDKMPRWFEWLLNTPSHHRVHHATNARYLDANYAGVFMLWDRMFGSFVPEDAAEKPRYGIIKNLGSFNPFVIAFSEWINLGRDLLSARSMREVVGYTLGPPGWSPDGSRLTSAKIKERLARMESERALAPAE
jgi:sterol desaturase/sphingolipid hydroxylase (fatty acid hydroxylase superfamily)